jgi:hypothetical protein
LGWIGCTRAARLHEGQGHPLRPGRVKGYTMGAWRIAKTEHSA